LNRKISGLFARYLDEGSESIFELMLNIDTVFP
jgi:hypothetical protein